VRLDTAPYDKMKRMVIPSALKITRMKPTRKVSNFFTPFLAPFIWKIHNISINSRKCKLMEKVFVKVGLGLVHMRHRSNCDWMFYTRLAGSTSLSLPLWRRRGRSDHTSSTFRGKRPRYVSNRLLCDLAVLLNTRCWQKLCNHFGSCKA